MADALIDIERVVREVMAALGLAPEPRAGGPGPATANEAGGRASSGPPAESEPAEVVVASRVVTLAELEGRLDNGVRRLLVPPQAVVTPSVRDELRRRNIELAYGQPAAVAGRPAAVPLVIAVHGAPANAESLVRALVTDGLPVQWRRSDCIIAATDQLSRRLAGGGALGVLLTSSTAAAVCLANRLAGIRAVLGWDPAAVSDDVASVGANLLVVNPAGSGLFRGRQIIRQFYRQGPQVCPKVFEQRLA